MIKIGCLARFFNKYEDEVRFAEGNGFEFMQIWYDNNGIALQKDENPIDEIKEQGFPTIIHAVLDIDEFEEHVPRLIDILKYLSHKELIIHPVCKSKAAADNTIYMLCDKVKYAVDLLKNEGITLYLENNSRLDPIFNTGAEIKIMFEKNPELKLLMDVAHMDNYEHIKEIVKIKRPSVLHIADRHLEVIHEHLPVGQGNINYKYIFDKVLYDFDGKVILEIVQSDKDIIDSKLKIEEIYNNREVQESTL